MFDWFKKERPLLGLTGSGGGLGYLSGGGGGFEASGGNVRDAYNAGNGYIYHTFTSPGNFVATSSEYRLSRIETWLSRKCDLGIDLLGDCFQLNQSRICLLYTSPSPRDKRQSRMPSSA